jgi:hypothetical protein
MNRIELMDRLQLNRYDIQDVLEICPFELWELQSKKRTRELTMWRDVSMIWVWLQGATTVQAAQRFNRDHSTLIYSVQKLADTLDGFGFYELRDILERIKYRIRCEVNQDPEIGVNEMVSLVILENEYQELIQRPYNDLTNQINRQMGYRFNQ